MRLNIGSLQKLVSRTVDEQKSVQSLKEEIGRVLGPSVITEGKLHDAVVNANDRLEVLSRTGRIGSLQFDDAIVAPFTSHSNAEVRKFAARVVSEGHLGKLRFDADPTVRAVVASRVPLRSLKEMMKKFPNDDQLRSIFRTRRLSEAGLPKPEVVDEPFDMNGERLGDVGKTQDDELSDAWYADRARRLLVQFGQNIEYAWEEVAVKNFCRALKATSGVVVDEKKLYDELKKLINDKEELAMERDALKETLQWLKGVEEKELIEEGIIPDCAEDVDPVTEMANTFLSNDDRIRMTMELFEVRQSTLPLAIRKYRLGEGNARQVFVPSKGRLPHNFGVRAVDEKVLDAFCEAWTKRQQLSGEPLKLEWVLDPTDVNNVCFTCILK